MTAQLVIVGGGILGCALAWRLAQRGICPAGSILVVDAQPLASQASSRAAALLSLSRPGAKAHWIPLVRQTIAAIDELNAAGCFVPLKRCGSLHLADQDPAQAVLADHETTARAHGVACRRVAPFELAGHAPWLDMGRFSEALWFPDEAYTDPYQLAAAYARAARQLGVCFRTDTPARLVAEGSRVAVSIGSEILRPASVWVAAGAWSSRVLQTLGTCAAQAAVRSQYWITGPMPAADRLSIVLAADLRLYARPEVGGLLFGLRERDGVAADNSRLPEDLDGFLFDPADPEGIVTLEAFAEVLAHYAPGLMAAELRHYITGPSCYTPDGEFLIGGVPGHDNLYLLAGDNGAGIAVSAGLADLAADVAAGSLADTWAALFAPGRFGAVEADHPDWLARCIAARAGKTSG